MKERTFGDGKRAFFWIKQGKPDPASVDEFYRAAMSAGARDLISPRSTLLTVRIMWSRIGKIARKKTGGLNR